MKACIVPHFQDLSLHFITFFKIFQHLQQAIIKTFIVAHFQQSSHYTTFLKGALTFLIGALTVLKKEIYLLQMKPTQDCTAQVIDLNYAKSIKRKLLY